MNDHRMPGPGDLPGDRNHPNSPDYDSSWDERIADRAEELYAERIGDEGRVRDQMDHFFTLGSGDVLERALTRFYLAFDAAQTNDAMAEAGYALFRDLEPQVSGSIRAEAEQEAESEIEDEEYRAERDRGDYEVTRWEAWSVEQTFTLRQEKPDVLP